MIVKILIVLAVLVIGLLVFVALQPAHFRVARSTTIGAPAAALFERVNDLRGWPAWSPYAKRDPNMKTAFEGPAAGLGAIYRWDGNNDVGAGSMTVVDSRPGERVRMRLDFLRPFKGTNTADFTFAPRAGGATEVTWTLNGEKNFVSKAACLFMNMDKMCGGDFEVGLAQLKTLAEAAPTPQGVAVAVP
ncbi:MAG: hypothetical protein JWO31_2899 [Phycisphaerales bacterium]|nr:hypothetical protein [Phycisphaerales bacterium]